MSSHIGSLILIGFLSGLFGLLIGVPMVVWVIRRYLRRDNVLDRIETVDGVVTNTGVKEIRNSGSHGPKYRYQPTVRFRYEYDGQTYESDRRYYNMLFGRTSESRAESTAAEFPEGSSVSVYVDPEDPEHGFLEVGDTRQTGVSLILLFIGATTALMGLAGWALFFVALLVL